ncbi:MAG: hypothetical protein ACRDHD_00790 [Candidatus Limnocylindria bacterium]
MLPLIWTLFAVSTVGGFLVIAAYWLDVQDRPDLSFRARMTWSLGVLAFPLAIPAYAFLGGPGWPGFLRAASLLPAFALVLFFGFYYEVFS